MFNEKVTPLSVAQSPSGHGSVSLWTEAHVRVHGFVMQISWNPANLPQKKPKARGTTAIKSSDQWDQLLDWRPFPVSPLRNGCYSSPGQKKTAGCSIILAWIGFTVTDLNSRACFTSHLYTFTAFNRDFGHFIIVHFYNRFILKILPNAWIRLHIIY